MKDNIYHCNAIGGGTFVMVRWFGMLGSASAPTFIQAKNLAIKDAIERKRAEKSTQAERESIREAANKFK